MTHANAPLPPEGRRRLAHLVVEEGWPVRRAAERFQVSPATARACQVVCVCGVGYRWGLIRSG